MGKKRTCVIDLPGLSGRLIESLDPELRPDWFSRLLTSGLRRIEPILPAVTMVAQATYTTGVGPDEHGIIANGLPAYRDESIRAYIDRSNYLDYRSTVSFWEQSDRLLKSPRVWAGGEERVAMLFMQSSMGGAAQIVVTPKPEHTPDGKTLSLCWTSPGDLYRRLREELGEFPLRHYWGPLAGIQSSEWIVAAASRVWSWEEPDLQWTYIPHMDYCLQTRGPNDASVIEELIQVLDSLTPLVESVEASGGRVVVLSDYGITPVDRSVAVNVALREAGLLSLNARGEVDYAKTPAFAMCDHQVAHIYCQDRETRTAVKTLMENLPGVGELYVGGGRAAVGLNCQRAGDIVAFADERSWFEYRWWTDFAEAPDYAWTVDIHRKPGYDPLEMTFDMSQRRIRADEPGLIRGSHGRRPGDEQDWPVLIGLGGEGEKNRAIEVSGLLQQ